MPITVLLARQRSGTGALGSILDQHAGIRYLGEVFHPHGTDAWPNWFQFEQQIMHEDTGFMLPDRTADRFDRYLDWITSETGDAAVVLDIKYRSTHHLNPYWQGLSDPPYLLKLLREREIPVLHLTRRNFLKTYISGELAERNKVWHATRTDEVKTTEMTIDIADMHRHLERTASEVALMTRLIKGFPSSFSIDYQEAFNEKGLLRHKAARQIGNFLIGEPLLERGTPYIKQTPDALGRVITNLGAVSQALTGTLYEWMVHD